MIDIALKCTEEMVGLIDAISEFTGNVFTVFSEDELMERTKGLSFPCVGIVYLGITGTDQGQSKPVISSELILSVMVFFRQDTRAVDDPKENILKLLDTIRGALLGKRSPTGHYWKFRLEAPIEMKRGLLAYIQRWAAPVQLSN